MSISTIFPEIVEGWLQCAVVDLSSPEFIVRDNVVWVLRYCIWDDLFKTFLLYKEKPLSNGEAHEMKMNVVNVGKMLHNANRRKSASLNYENVRLLDATDYNRNRSTSDIHVISNVARLSTSNSSGKNSSFVPRIVKRALRKVSISSPFRQEIPITPPAVNSFPADQGPSWLSQSHESLLATHPVGIAPEGFIYLHDRQGSLVRHLHPSVLGESNCFHLQSNSHEDDIVFRAQNETDRNNWVTSMNFQNKGASADDVSRVDYRLMIDIQECRHLKPKKRYFCEILIDDVVYGVTQTKLMTSSSDCIIFEEIFHFRNLRRSNYVRVCVYKETDKKRKGKKCLIGHADANLDSNCISQNQTTWHQLIPPNSKTPFSADGPGVRFCGVFEAVHIWPLHIYNDLLDIVVNQYSEIYILCEEFLGLKDKTKFANSLVQILHDQSKINDYFSAILQIELSKHSGQKDLVFRANSLATKSMEAYAKLMGQKYIEEVLSGKIQEVVDSNLDLDVETNPEQKYLKENQDKIAHLCSDMWQSVYDSSAYFPTQLREVFWTLRSTLHNCEDSVIYNIITSSLFLRLLCAAILTPHMFLLQRAKPNENVSQTLKLISKVVMKLANDTLYREETESMKFMNPFLEREAPNMHNFINSISSQPEANATLTEPAFRIDIGRELSIIHNMLTKLPSHAFDKLTELPNVLKRIGRPTSNAANIHCSKLYIAQPSDSTRDPHSAYLNMNKLPPSVDDSTYQSSSSTLPRSHKLGRASPPSNGKRPQLPPNLSEIFPPPSSSVAPSYENVDAIRGVAQGSTVSSGSSSTIEHKDPVSTMLELAHSVRSKVSSTAQPSVPDKTRKSKLGVSSLNTGRQLNHSISMESNMLPSRIRQSSSDTFPSSDSLNRHKDRLPPLPVDVQYSLADPPLAFSNPDSSPTDETKRPAGFYLNHTNPLYEVCNMSPQSASVGSPHMSSAGSCGALSHLSESSNLQRIQSDSSFPLSQFPSESELSRLNFPTSTHSLMGNSPFNMESARQSPSLVNSSHSDISSQPSSCRYVTRQPLLSDQATTTSSDDHYSELDRIQQNVEDLQNALESAQRELDMNQQKLLEQERTAQKQAEEKDKNLKQIMHRLTLLESKLEQQNLENSRDLDEKQKIIQQQEKHIQDLTNAYNRVLGLLKTVRTGNNSTSAASAAAPFLNSSSFESNAFLTDSTLL